MLKIKFNILIKSHIIKIYLYIKLNVFLLFYRGVHFENFYYINLYFVVWLKYFEF